MQTRDKKRNFFGGYRHGNRSMPKLTGHTRQKSTTDEKEQEVDNESKKKTQIEKALEKANTAVLFDSANNFKSACLSYKEAVTLLQDVLLADPFRNDRPRLQNICDTYNERIRVLSKSIDPSPTITPTSPTKITDTTTKTSTKTTTTTAKTNTNTTKDTLLENSGVNDMRAITEGLSTSASSSPSSSWRLGKGGKRRAKSRPTSMVHDESDDAASAYTVDSTKTTTSLFTSLFAKKGLNAKHNKENPTMQHHDLSSSVTLNSGPKPSKSTPIAPFSRSPRTWLPQADRKKRHSSDSMDKQGNEQLPPPSLPLPELSSTPNNQEDYFDLGSLGASDLLLNAPSSRYSALHTTTATTKATTTKNDGREGGREKNGQDNNHYKNRVNQYVGIDLILEEDPTNMNDTMDMLAKVMNESNHDDMGDTTCSSEDTSTAPLIVPPPRKQSITSTKQTTTTEKDHRDDYYFLSTVEEEHCSKSSSSAGSTTTSSSLSLPSTTSSPPLAPVPCPSTSSSTNNNNNNGQGLSSFWRAHTFSTRRSAHSSSAQSPPQSPPPSSSSSLSSRKKNNNKKHEPSLPPLHLPKNSNNNHPPPPANSSRASSTRTRSTSNASAKSRQSVASASSPTTLSSPSSQSSNRNGWSSFDLQSRSNNYNNNNNNPPSSLFNASVASLALSPKERTQFFDPPKIDPAVFLSEPEPKAGVNDLPLTQRILKCLVEGGYLTDRLYVPKQLW
ncbi:hypothetical protein BDA99DRAFT_226352 [Phascolomyces articulosus]|uniref:MIT domain-containing protein n=1 Tax=Phascolomyces articulosus TaxID=60185 RepID=A0AAD5JZ89_9FUNG|nr:hypothetical protein BDA99DRAFT_226352 [Phascolomyces articulosus]